MQRPYNFSAGPAAIPEEVLRQAAAEMLDWHGSGMGVMEMSHRGKEFISIYEAAEAGFRGLLAIPPEFKILFMQGGGLAENAIVPLNLSRAAGVDFVVTGSWSQTSQKEARKYASDVHIAASGEASGFTTTCPPGEYFDGIHAAFFCGRCFFCGRRFFCWRRFFCGRCFFGWGGFFNGFGCAAAAGC